MPHARRLWPCALIGLFLLTGCLSKTVPSAAHPSCSWTTQPPANADSVCVQAFRTLRDVLAASVSGDTASLRRMVPRPEIRRKIQVFGTGVRRRGDISVHITPSFTLEQAPDGSLGAGFNMVGTTRHGDVRAPQTVFLARSHGQLIIVNDQPGEEW